MAVVAATATAEAVPGAPGFDASRMNLTYNFVVKHGYAFLLRTRLSPPKVKE